MKKKKNIGMMRYPRRKDENVTIRNHKILFLIKV